MIALEYLFAMRTVPLRTPISKLSLQIVNVIFVLGLNRGQHGPTSLTAEMTGGGGGDSSSSDLANDSGSSGHDSGSSGHDSASSREASDAGFSRTSSGSNGLHVFDNIRNCTNRNKDETMKMSSYKIFNLL